MTRHEIESEVAGNVWKVLCEVGAQVDAGDVVMILESMKMEIPVEAPVGGRLAQICVAEEDQVEEDQLLAVLEAS